MVVDAWMQHPTRRFLEHEMFASLRRWTGRRDRPARAAGRGDARGDGRAAASSFGVLLRLARPAGRADLQRGGGRLRRARTRTASPALASVDLAGRWRPCASCAAASTELGFEGLRMVPWLWEAPPTDRRFYPLYAACVELGVPFCTQVGHTGPLRPSEPGRPIPYIDQVAIDFPELVIVGGHIGYPWTEEMIAVARKHENVYIDTSAYTRARLPAELVALPADAAAGAQGAVRQQLPDDRPRARRSRTSTARARRRGARAVPGRERPAGVRAVGRAGSAQHGGRPGRSTEGETATARPTSEHPRRRPVVGRAVRGRRVRAAGVRCSAYGSAPRVITAGPDARCGSPERCATASACIDARGRVAGARFRAGLPPGAEPNGIVAADDGNLWFTDPRSDAVGRVTPGGSDHQVPGCTSAPGAGAPRASPCSGRRRLVHRPAPAHSPSACMTQAGEVTIVHLSQATLRVQCSGFDRDRC